MGREEGDTICHKKPCMGGGEHNKKGEKGELRMRSGKGKGEDSLGRGGGRP